MKTLYDWKPGHRGEILEPRGSSSKLQSVVLYRAGVLEELYRGGRLHGEALKDAEKDFGKEKSK